MTQASRTVLEAALALEEAERAEVAEQLLRSLGGGSLPEIDDAWAAEAERRLRAYRDGKIRSYPADEVFASLLPRDVK